MIKKNLLIRFLACGFLFSLAALPANASAADSLSDTGFFFDTIVTLTLNGTSDEAVMDACFDLMETYETMLSRTREGSDIWNINHSGGEATEVNEETADLISMALQFCELSDGAFDITTAPVSDLWDFQNNTGILPDDADLQEALSHVDYHTVSVDGTTVTLSDPDAEIDLGGVAKGYIADQLKELLLSNGVESALINLGGNILTVGTKPDGSNWRIGVQKPFGGSSDLIAVVKSDGDSIVTSGTYERYFELDGKIYHHILDTETGYPVDNGLSSVTILSESSAQGDALSTTCFVLGLDEGMKLIEATDGVEALFVTEDLELHRSSGFPED